MIENTTQVKLGFYKKNNIWYACVPQHTEAENEMVAGSDVLLDLLYNIRKGCIDDNITLILRTKAFQDSLLTLTMIDHNSVGATYKITGGALANVLGILNENCWICNVTHTVFGAHPAELSIIDIY